jgi:hypothetical protein
LAIELSRIWLEHLAAGCPRGVEGVEIAGSNAQALDAEITACLSALVCRCLTVDERIARRLTEISCALAERQADTDEEVAAYCARLNKLVSAILTEPRAGPA